MADLLELVDLARLSPSAGNLQSLRYVVSCDPQKNAVIFKYLAWAAYLADWRGPEEGERPGGYIIILRKTDVRYPMGVDHGIAAQSILLGAVEKGLGGCLIGAIDREGLAQALGLIEGYEILLVVALGKPKERVMLEPLADGGDIKYWRDHDGVHHVPKHALADVVVG